MGYKGGDPYHNVPVVLVTYRESMLGTREPNYVVTCSLLSNILVVYGILTTLLNQSYQNFDNFINLSKF